MPCVDLLSAYSELSCNVLCCEPDVMSVLCRATYCVGVSMYDYDCLILYECFSLEEYELDNEE